MTQINAVLGSIDIESLGYTLVHEHILSTSAGLQSTYPEFINRQATIDLAVKHLQECYKEGIRTLVDMAPFDLGRDIHALVEVSQKSGVQIVTTTGCWLNFPREFSLATPETLAPLFIKEITEGIEGTKVRAGIIKASTAAGGVTKGGEIVLRAVARAHKATGIPISTHTFAPERTGNQQVDILEDEGVNLNNVCIGHSNDTTDMEYLFNLLQRGVWLGLDHFPGGSSSDGGPDRQTRILLIKQLIEAGYGHRIMLSHDFNITMHKSNEIASQERWESNPDGFLYIKRKVLPQLLESGITAQQTKMLNEDNPRTFFGSNS